MLTVPCGHFVADEQDFCVSCNNLFDLGKFRETWAWAKWENHAWMIHDFIYADRWHIQNRLYLCNVSSKYSLNIQRERGKQNWGNPCHFHQWFEKCAAVKMVTDSFLVFCSKCHCNFLKFWTFWIAFLKELVFPLEVHCPNIAQGTKLPHKVRIVFQVVMLWL